MIFMIENFDKKDIYNAMVKPIVDQLRNECNKLGLPMFCAVAVSGDENKTDFEYQYEILSPYVTGKTVKDNKIAKFVDVVRGYNVAPPNDFVEIPVEDLTI